MFLVAVALAPIGLAPLQASAATYPPAYPATNVTGAWSALVPAVSGSPTLFDIGCPVVTRCFAVGQAGTIEAGSATSSWTKVFSGTTLDLFSISCPGSGACFAAGGTTGSGVIVSRTKGRGWRRMFTVNQQLHGIGCASASTCIAVGDNGLILQTANGGRTWKSISSGVLMPIEAVFCPVSTLNCLAVGSRGMALVSTNSGSSWTSRTNGISADFGAVWCDPAMTSCVVGGGAGMWLATNQAQSWVQVENTAGFKGLCLTAGCAFADSLAVMTTTNAGQTWVTQSTGFSQSVLAVTCNATTDCYGVGDSGLIAHSAATFATPSPPAITITQFPNPNPNAFAQAVVAGPDGAMWATEFRGNAILRTPLAGAQQEFPLATAGSEPEAITAGPDGALWFTESGTGRIGRITTAGAITEYPITDWSCSTCNIPDIVAGPDGALWFTELQSNRIGRITTAGAITEFSVPAATLPEHIVSAPDGNLWFAGYEGTINRMTPAGVLTMFSVPTTGGGGIVGITVGPDGNLWFTATVGSWIGVITTAGVVLTQYTVHPGIEGITSIVTGPDGALWFADVQTIDRITVGGLLTEYPSIGESWLTLGPGNRSLWYASFANSQLGEVTSTSF
jgi:virginiamycin B lyase